MSPDTCNIALFGCGTVGAGVASMLLGRQGAVKERFGDRLELTHIVDKRMDYVRSEVSPPDSVRVTDDLDGVLRDDEVDVAVELFGGLDAAGEVVETALRNGKHVVTANKALLAKRGDHLFRVARECGRSIAYEASAAGCIPIISALREDFAADRVQSIYGIVNGTCNYILTRMTEAGLSYDEALQEAMNKGYAEADPTLDVEGLDSAHKLAVMARLAFGAQVELDDVACEGITDVSVEDIRYARGLGWTLKLLAMGMRTERGMSLRVHPTLLPHAHPLASIRGAYNAVCVHTDTAGEVILTGKGAGRWPTANAVVGDICRLALGTYQPQFSTLAQFGDVERAQSVDIDEVRCRYYFRLSCMDRPGVLAQTSGILGEENVSISSCVQQDTGGEEGEQVPVVFMTHTAREGDVQRALDRINNLDCIEADGTHMLRVQHIRGESTWAGDA